VSETRKEQPPGLFVPTIDRTKCEGGYHHACADAKCPCVPACPYGVLEIRPLTAADKRLLSLGDRVRAWSIATGRRLWSGPTPARLARDASRRVRSHTSSS